MTGEAVTELYRRIAGVLEASAVVELARELVAVETVTGFEQRLSGVLSQRLERLGIVPEVKEFAEGRTNVYGHLRGGGVAPPVLLVAHSDTVRVPNWSAAWGEDPRSDRLAGSVVDGSVWGSGVADDKGGIAIHLAALEGLRRAGITPPGDVLVAAVGDEESGEAGLGRSLGARALVEEIESGRLPKPAFAVYSEPTRLDVYAAQVGFFIAEIVVRGRASYFAEPWRGRDAVRDANRVLSALYEYEAELSSRRRHPLVGRPVLVVTSIEGGESVAVPERCTIRLIRSLLPGDTLDVAALELGELLQRLSLEHGVASELSFTAPRDHRLGGSPVSVDPELAPVRLLAEAAAVESKSSRIGGAPYWSELPLLDEIGIPGVYFGAGDITDCHTAREHVAVAELERGARSLACFLAALPAPSPGSSHQPSPR